MARLTVSAHTANITTMAHQCLHRAPSEFVSCSISRWDTLLVVTYRTQLWQATARGITRVTAPLHLSVAREYCVFREATWPTKPGVVSSLVVSGRYVARFASPSRSAGNALAANCPDVCDNIYSPDLSKYSADLSKSTDTFSFHQSGGESGSSTTIRFQRRSMERTGCQFSDNPSSCGMRALQFALSPILRNSNQGLPL